NLSVHKVHRGGKISAGVFHAAHQEGRLTLFRAVFPGQLGAADSAFRAQEISGAVVHGGFDPHASPAMFAVLHSPLFGAVCTGFDLRREVRRSCARCADAARRTAARSNEESRTADDSGGGTGTV